MRTKQDMAADLQKKKTVVTNSSFPFWNAPDNTTTTIRLLPDGDPDGQYFWVENSVIKLTFQGVKGEHDNEVIVQVPCAEMFGLKCPILNETRAWWKGSTQDVERARKYWKKKSYIFQGFVVSTQVEEKEPPENPIRKFVFNKSIYDIIHANVVDPEVEDLATDYVTGRDLKIVKTKQGEFANYSTSNWSFKTRPLTSNEQAAIEKYGLSHLKDFLGKKPTADDLKVIYDMFQASLNDEAYDPARWANYYKPYGLQYDGPSLTDGTDPQEKKEPVSEFKPSYKMAVGESTMDVLQRIKAKHGEKVNS